MVLLFFTMFFAYFGLNMFSYMIIDTSDLANATTDNHYSWFRIYPKPVICFSNQQSNMVVLYILMGALFLSSGNISKESSLFAYDSKYLLDTYHVPPSHDPAFVPAFSLPEGSDDPLVAGMLKICFGEGGKFCKYDTLTTRSLKVGNATLRAYQNYQTQMAALEPGTM